MSFLRELVDDAKPQSTAPVKLGVTGIARSFQVGSNVLQVAARLTALMGDDNRLLLVTGYDEQDGAAELSAQLAVGLARITHAPTVLVDGNRKVPSLDRIFDTPARPGFGDLIAGNAELESTFQPVMENVTLIPGGSRERELALPVSARIFDSLRARFRYVVVSAAPLLLSSEAITLTTQSDGVVVSLKAGRRQRDEVRELQREIARLKGRLLGAVLREQG